MKITWFRITMLIGWLCIIIFFVNMSMTDYSAGILDYNGFIPETWSLIFPFIWWILCFISFGAEIVYDRDYFNLR